MVKNVKRYMKQQKKEVFPGLVADFVPVTYILPQVSCHTNANHDCKDTFTCVSRHIHLVYKLRRVHDVTIGLSHA